MRTATMSPRPKPDPLAPRVFDRLGYATLLLHVALAARNARMFDEMHVECIVHGVEGEA